MKQQQQHKMAYGVNQFYSKNFKTLEFEGDWKELVGEPEPTGSWFVWGNSGNGKTSFAVQLAKYLSRFGRVAYNSIEEGLSESLRRAFQVADITEKDDIILLDKENMTDLKVRLRRKKSPSYIIVDSFQYTGLNAHTYKKLVSEFKNKLFIFISHADGRKPAGRSANTVHYDSNVKIWIEGFKAFAKSRYGGGSDFVIWEEKANEIWLNS
jgi:hypothetical protein